jgi:diaminohydroxyphosphoribosylaminopyrimidine deaminase/5-amino-6-(5-phosphoribosylamino)uracil reductase
MPNPAVGCVVVREGRIVGAGTTQPPGSNHAEIEALRAAGEAARGATVYVTLEPCCHQGRTPPCTNALIAAGVATVVFGAVDPNPLVNGGGAAVLLRAGITVRSGVMADATEALNRGFFQRMRIGRPFVHLKLGLSLDGRMALASGESRWITAEPARADVQRLRAHASAILTGIGTVLADDPALTLRPPYDAARPCALARVVLDSRLRLPPTARLLQTPEPVLLFTRSEDSDAAAALRAVGAQIFPIPAGATDICPSSPRRRGSRHRHGVDLNAVLAALAALEMNEVLVEAGPTLAGAFLAAGLADELTIYLAPKLLGHEGLPALVLPTVTAMAACPALTLIDTRRVGADLRITARPTRVPG